MKKIILAALVGLMIGPSALFAEMLQGKLITIEDNGREATFVVSDHPVYRDKQIRLSLEKVATLLGAARLEDLKPGDEVKIQAVDNNQPIWQVDRIEVVTTRSATGKEQTRIKETTAVSVPGETYEVSYDKDVAAEEKNPKYRMQERTETKTVHMPPSTYVSEEERKV